MTWQNTIQTSSIEEVSALLTTTPTLLTATDPTTKDNIFHLATHNTPEVMLYLLRQFGNTYSALLKAKNKSGITPLQYACRSSTTEEAIEAIIKFDPSLISAVSLIKSNIFHLAAQNVSPNVLIWLVKNYGKACSALLKAKNKLGVTPLQYACQFSTQKAIEEIIKLDPSLISGVSDDKSNIFHFAAQNASPNALIWLVKNYGKIHSTLLKAKNKSGVTPLQYACQFSTQEAIEEIIKLDPSLISGVSDDKSNIFHFAAQNASPNTLIWLVKNYGKIHSTLLKAKNKSGVAPLLYACLSNTTQEAIEEIIKLDPSLINEAAQNKFNIFHFAAKNVSPNALIWLVKNYGRTHSALLKAKNTNGSPALFCAIETHSDQEALISILDIYEENFPTLLNETVPYLLNNTFVRINSGDEPHVGNIAHHAIFHKREEFLTKLIERHPNLLIEKCSTNCLILAFNTASGLIIKIVIKALLKNSDPTAINLLKIHYSKITQYVTEEDLIAWYVDQIKHASNPTEKFIGSCVIKINDLLEKLHSPTNSLEKIAELSPKLQTELLTQMVLQMKNPKHLAACVSSLLTLPLQNIELTTLIKICKKLEELWEQSLIRLLLLTYIDKMQGQDESVLFQLIENYYQWQSDILTTINNEINKAIADKIKLFPVKAQVKAILMLTDPIMLSDSTQTLLTHASLKDLTPEKVIKLCCHLIVYLNSNSNTLILEFLISYIHTIQDCDALLDIMTLYYSSTDLQKSNDISRAFLERINHFIGQPKKDINKVDEVLKTLQTFGTADILRNIESLFLDLYKSRIKNQLAVYRKEIHELDSITTLENLREILANYIKSMTTTISGCNKFQLLTRKKELNSLLEKIEQRTYAILVEPTAPPLPLDQADTSMLVTSTMQILNLCSSSISEAVTDADADADADADEFLKGMKLDDETPDQLVHTLEKSESDDELRYEGPFATLLG